MKTFYTLILIVLFIVASPWSQASTSSSTIQWVDLIPESELNALLNPPAAISAIPHDGTNSQPIDPLADAVENAIGRSQQMTPEEQAYYDALKSTNINAEYNNKRIRIAGFIVPVEYNDEMVVSEFFLVPYFGACIHVPPPPPNQIIYVKYPKGLKIDALYDPFWVEGELFTEIVENDLALSAYTLNAEDIKLYDGYNG